MSDVLGSDHLKWPARMTSSSPKRTHIFGRAKLDFTNISCNLRSILNIIAELNVEHSASILFGEATGLGVTTPRVRPSSERAPVVLLSRVASREEIQIFGVICEF